MIQRKGLMLSCRERETNIVLERGIDIKLERGTDVE